MNKTKMKKNEWSHVRLRPVAKRFWGADGPQLPPRRAPGVGPDPSLVHRLTGVGVRSVTSGDTQNRPMRDT